MILIKTIRSLGTSLKTIPKHKTHNLLMHGIRQISKAGSTKIIKFYLPVGLQVVSPGHEKGHLITSTGAAFFSSPMEVARASARSVLGLNMMVAIRPAVPQKARSDEGSSVRLMTRFMWPFSSSACKALSKTSG